MTIAYASSLFSKDTLDRSSLNCTRYKTWQPWKQSSLSPVNSLQQLSASMFRSLGLQFYDAFDSLGSNFLLFMGKVCITMVVYWCRKTFQNMNWQLLKNGAFVPSRIVSCILWRNMTKCTCYIIITKQNKTYTHSNCTHYNFKKVSSALLYITKSIRTLFE